MSRAYACVEEACAYAKSLGLAKRFSVYTRSAAEGAHAKTLARAYSSPVLHGKESSQQQQEMMQKTVAGAGRRIERMMIEVMGERGEPTQLMSLAKFYEEHDRLQMEVRRRRSLMPSAQRAQEMQVEKEREGAKDRKDSSVKRKGLRSDVASFDEMLATSAKKQEGGMGLTKKEKVEKLHDILAESVEATRVLEEQLREMQSRGWNESVLR